MALASTSSDIEASGSVLRASTFDQSGSSSCIGDARPATAVDMDVDSGHLPTPATVLILTRTGRP